MTEPVIHSGLGKEIMKEREKEIKKNLRHNQGTICFLAALFFSGTLKYSPEFNYPNLGAQQVEFEEHL